MSKRFIDTELWDKSAFNAASPKLKLLTIFITCKCDCVGVFKMAPMLINAYVGEPVTEEEILSIPCDIIKLKDGSYFLEKFCMFQYGELSEKCKPHRKYIQMLKQYSLFERVCKGYAKGINTLQEKEEEEEKEEEKETRVIFKEPTIEEVSDYCTNRSNGIDAEEFIDHYKAKNWMIGKNKMKDWRAAVRTWEKKRKSQAKNTSGHQTVETWKFNQ